MMALFAKPFLTAVLTLGIVVGIPLLIAQYNLCNSKHEDQQRRCWLNMRLAS